MGGRKITIALFLLQLSVVLSHTVSPTALTNASGDVDEIQEGEKQTTFVHPQQKKPTLREIVYYHFVERPYGKTVLDRPKPLGIDFDDAPGSFTNSHGYQFTDEHAGDSDAAIKSEITTESPSIISTGAKDIKMQQARETLLTKLAERRNNIKNISNNMQQARETLLTKLAERRNNIKNISNNITSANERTKRDVKEIPEAPKLEEIDLPQLGYVFGTVEPLMDHDEDPSSEYTYPADDHESNIKDKVESIFVTLKPFGEPTPTQADSVVGYLVKKDNEATQGRRTGHDEDGNKIEYHNNGNGRPDNIMTEMSRVTPDSKTYGMNLSSVHGYVWNKLVEPAVLYAVDTDVTPTIAIDTDEQQEYATEPPDHEDFDIYVNIKRHPKSKGKISTEARNAKFTKKQTRDKYHTKKENEDEKNKKPQRKQKRNKHETPDLYHQLLDSDKFWQWLAHWTSSYTEQLIKTVKDMVKQEVEKQLKKSNPDKPDLSKTKDEGTSNNENDPDKTGNQIQTDGNAEWNDEYKANPSTKNDTKTEESTTSVIKPDNKENPTEKFHDRYKIVTGNEKATNIFILLPDASTKEIIQSIIGIPPDDKENRDNNKNETSQNEEQKNKIESSNKLDKEPKVEKSKDVNATDEKIMDQKSKDETSKNEMPNDKKSVEQKPEKEISKDEARKDEKPENAKPNEEKLDQEMPKEPKEPEGLKPNLPTTTEKNEASSTI